jgi:hypothetical protein
LKQFRTLGREPAGTLQVELKRAPSIGRHSAKTPDSSARSDAQIKQLSKINADLSHKIMCIQEIATDLVKKNNSDNDINAERERTIKASLRAANKTINLLRTLCTDTPILNLLNTEDVPETITKLQRLDETTYVRDKMAAREVATKNAGSFGLLLDAAEDRDAEI